MRLKHGSLLCSYARSVAMRTIPMCLFRLFPMAAVCVALTAASAATATDGEITVADEMTLRAAGIATDGPGLLEFFRKRNLADLPAKDVNALVVKLGSDDRAVREKAAVELTVLGPAALPSLRALAADPDLGESAALARRCL